ncbi:transglycosylase domain-containing protein [Halalkalibacter krulwichiae]|uniref:Penicillin-binding protein 1F n=1 Tax=Halalkalibacter krulwichiae TaxID=199441 RepID=A0A1X9M6W3_9BACI|nr:PBP1A family penicillin-binding protein [Halalkalibacter krulwichiae]ARK29185.1 Penicillin-binding protein 1F [Halalkalibacter krulwichiae]
MKKKILIAVSSLLSFVLFALIIYLFVILIGNYAIDNEKLVMKATTSLTDQNGEVLTHLFIENREPVSIQEIPKHVQDAFVVIEDVRFREHQGVDFRAIGRALYRDILAGAKVEGGSTITQQLAKNVFLTNEKTWLRKTKEVLIAMNLERRYSKDQLLEKYLNSIYFGHGAYGIQAASTLYFNKDVADLSIEEGALLAGLPKAPNSYSPINNPDRSKERRDLVLTVMQRHEVLEAEEAKRLKGKTVATNVNRFEEKEAFLTYIDMVMDEAESRYHLTQEELLTGGYRIVTPIDLRMQEVTYKKLKENRYFPTENEDAEAAVVLIDAHTGGVIAVQGGRDYVRRGLNRVNVKRQPGSAFKPLAVYAPAIENGRHPYTMLVDELLDYNGYTPRNYSHQYTGYMTMYDALTISANAPAVWLLNDIGIERSLEVLNRFNITIEDRGLAIALGGLTEGITPLQLASSYHVFANEGVRVEPYFIKEIYDRNGKRLDGEPLVEEEVIEPQTAWYMTRMLESVIQNGTGRHGDVQAMVAGKTGTTSFPGVEGAIMDAWFVGYSPDVVGTVWMGYDQTTNERYLHGGSAYPTVLFKDIINELPASLRQTTFQKPTAVTELESPIELPVVTDLKATFSIGGRGISSIHLDWTGPEEERVYYQIYEVNTDGRNHVATVVGDTQYYIGSLNPFTSKRYEIVPYDEITKQPGLPSNIAEVKFKFGLH